jgi:hypothetical protein
MPTPGCWWWHIILSTHSSWLPGDPRGFRSRHHRIHSSGDYRQPPPQGEHAGLHRYHKVRSEATKAIPPACRPVVGQTFLKKLSADDVSCLAVAVAAFHAHLLIEMTDDEAVVKRYAGKLKQHVSHAVGDALPGRLWASGCKQVRIRDQAHQRRVYHYILRHEAEGAWTWSFRDEPPSNSEPSD